MGKSGSGDFATYLDRAMRAAGYTKPTFLARKAGIDPSVVIRWLNADQRPTVASLERIAPVLGVPITDLVAAAYPSTGETITSDRPDLPVDPATGETYTDPDEQELWGVALPEADRRELIYHLRARRAARDAEQRQRRAG